MTGLGRLLAEQSGPGGRYHRTVRTLETLLPAVLAVWVAWPLLTGGGRRPLGHSVALIGAAVAVVHLFLEGFRWQMVPLYAFAGIAAVLAIWETIDPPAESTPPRGKSSAGFVAAGLGALLLSTALPWALPVPVLPDPPGEYAIGVATFGLTDTDRAEAYGPSPGQPREIVLRVWYPADPPDGSEPAPWADSLDVVGPALARQLGFPGFFFDHVEYTETHAVAGAPAASVDGGFPVVLYSHGWTGAAGLAIDQLEALASRGYVVAAPDHTFGAFATAFPDGRVIEVDRNALPEEDEVLPEVYDEAARRLVATYAADLSFVIDALPELDGPFHGQLDLERVGVFGHSTGGGAAALWCAGDDRCDAVLGFDPWVEPVPGEVIADGLNRPFLFFRSEEWTDYDNDAALRDFFEAGEAPGYWMSVDGSNHKDFVISTYVSPIASWIGLKGPIDGEQMADIVEAYLSGFFDRFLKDSASGILLGPPERFPEVRFEAGT